MYYLIGDIHGYADKLTGLYRKLERHVREEDTFIFLGDYIDRGPASYEVIDFLIYLQKKHQALFLKGNHEEMFINFMEDRDDEGIFLLNGGGSTIVSYKNNLGKFSIPAHHQAFYDNLILYFEGDDFIAVHAGLNPKVRKLQDQDERDLLWIRDSFYRADAKWAKTVIFGHTPTAMMPGEGLVRIDKKRNIIGIDSGVIFGSELVCLRWPDRKIFTS